jgi:KaiC/GvpD/RAD55 family RecA-like ATPase
MRLQELLECSGYIPKNEKEAQDPRWERALSVDVGIHTMEQQIADIFPVKPIGSSRLIQVTESESLTELFKSGKTWNWEFRGSEEAFASFKIGDIEYLWYARVMRTSRPKQWTIGFKQRDSEFDYDKEFGLAGTGNSAEVMSTVVDITRTFLTSYGDKVEEIQFTSAEPSRTKLYARMVKRLLPTWDFHTRLTGGQAGFYLINPAAYDTKDSQ